MRIIRINRRAIWMVLLSTFVASCGGGGSSGGGLTGSPPVDTLVFKGVDYSTTVRQDLYLASIDGQSLIQIAGVQGSDQFVSSFTVSPDRKWVAYEGQIERPRYDLYLSPITGGARTKVTRSTFYSSSAYLPLWAPNSSRLAYRGYDETDTREIYTVDPSTIDYARVSNVGLGVGSQFLWSPDSTKLHFSMRPMIGAQEQLFVADALGLGAVQVSSNNSDMELVSFLRPWSPDGNSISYMLRKNSSVQGLYAAAVDGTGAQRVNLDLLPEESIGGSSANKGVWSPSSQFIAFVVENSVTGEAELFVGSRDGTSVSNLSESLIGISVDREVLWSPDGQYLAFTGRDLNTNVRGVYVGAADGSSTVKVSGAMVAGGSAYRHSFLWHPYNGSLMYVADQEVDGMNELYSVQADGAGSIKLNGPVALGAVGVGAVTVLSSDFQWSPDGMFVAYRAYQDSASVSELYVSSIDGLSNVKVSGGLDVTHNLQQSFIWTSDSNTLVFPSRNDPNPSTMSLYANKRQGGIPWKISGNFHVVRAEFSPIDNF